MTGKRRKPAALIDTVRAHCICRQAARSAVCAALIVWLHGCASGRGSGFGGSLFGPKGAPWTIQCLEVEGPERMERLQPIADTLRRTPGIRAEDVFLRDEPDGPARLYYGTYHRRTDSKTGQRTMPAQLRKDLDLIKQLVAGDHRLFLRAIPVRMPTPDVGNADWNLRQVHATYTLQVAAFEPTDDFWEYKAAADKFCEYLRGEGYEAYYFHDDALSVVTVGAFGPDAVLMDRAGKTYYSNEVRALQQHELLKYNLLNGGVVKVKADTGQRVAVPSSLVEVPSGR